MKKNPSITLFAILVLMAVIGFVGYAYWDFGAGLILLFGGVILGGSVLIFKKEINLWVNKRTGRSLSEKEIRYLKDHFNLMQLIPVHLHAIFFQKVNLFCLDKEIISQDPEERVYHPAVLLCGAYAAFLEMKNPKLSVPLDSIPVYVFYGHPFPSPQFPQNLHISEYYEEDGALLFSVPHMIKGNEEPARYLNIALYESARVAMKGSNQSMDLPSLEKLCQHGGFTVNKMEEYLGLKRKNIDIKALALCQFFAEMDRFTAAFPQPGDLFHRKYLFTMEIAEGL